MKKLFAFAAALAIAGSAYALPNVANPAQKGSLLWAPDIDITGNRTTIVRMQNDGPEDMWVKCYYRDLAKNTLDFLFRITPNQPIWWDVASLEGTVGANIFPVGNQGMLVCWAVFANEQPYSYNHLSMTVTIVDFDDATAYEYSAYAFYRRARFFFDLLTTFPAGTGNAPVRAPLDVDADNDPANGFQVAGLALNGTDSYDYCPAQVIGTFQPFGATLGDDPGWGEFPVESRGVITVGETRIALASCFQDFREMFNRYFTKYRLNVWREDEWKLTEAYTCADGWHVITLGATGATASTPLTNGQIFRPNVVNGRIARYRIDSVVTTGICPANQPQYRTGILGVQSQRIDLGPGFATHGTTLTGVGTRTGFIQYDLNLACGPTDPGYPFCPVPEGKVR